MARSAAVDRHHLKYGNFCNQSDVFPLKEQSEQVSHLINKDGILYAGLHFLLDFWEASNLDSIDYMRISFKKAVDCAGATLLSMNFHHFTPNNGISGVAILSESHISVHTWPEYAYAAFDIFMCGDDAQPKKAVDMLCDRFLPKKYVISECKRGVFNNI